MRFFGTAFFGLSFFLFSWASLRAEIIPLSYLISRVENTFSARFHQQHTILWISLENARGFVAVFSNRESYKIESLEEGAYRVSKSSYWTNIVGSSISRGAMPRARFETMSPDEKVGLSILLTKASETHEPLDSLDGPVSAEQNFDISIVGGANSRQYIHSLYASGVSLGLILLMMTKPWTTSPTGFMGLLMATTGIPVIAFFVVAMRFPELFTNDRWNPLGRYSPMLIGLGITLAPTACHFALRLIP